MLIFGAKIQTSYILPSKLKVSLQFHAKKRVFLKKFKFLNCFEINCEDILSKIQISFSLHLKSKVSSNLHIQILNNKSYDYIQLQNQIKGKWKKVRK